MEPVVGSTPLEDAQHESFALMMAEDRTSQGRAYLDAGYECKSIEVAYAAASRLLRNVKVQARIKWLKEQAADRTVADRAFILEQLAQNSLDAREFRQFAASNRALELLGRERDMFKGKFVLETSEDDTLPDFTSMTPDEIRTWREERRKHQN